MPTSAPAAAREAGQARLQAGGSTTPKWHSVTGGGACRKGVHEHFRGWCGCLVVAEMPHHSALVRGSPAGPRQKAVPGQKHKVHMPQKQALGGLLLQRRPTPHARAQLREAVLVLKPGIWKLGGPRCALCLLKSDHTSRGLWVLCFMTESHSPWNICSRVQDRRQGTWAYWECKIPQLKHPESFTDSP